MLFEKITDNVRYCRGVINAYLTNFTVLRKQHFIRVSLASVFFSIGILPLSFLIFQCVLSLKKYYQILLNYQNLLDPIKLTSIAFPKKFSRNYLLLFSRKFY